MIKKELICIGCPIGCRLNIEMEGISKIISITGNICKRGEVYARKEVSNPTRIVTTTVKVINGKMDVVSVKTKKDIPKNKIYECIEALKDVTVKAPVQIGDIIYKNIANTGVDIVATRDCL